MPIAFSTSQHLECSFIRPDNKRMFIRDIKSVKMKIASLVSSSLERLMVISDFDYTLSCYSKNGKKCHTTHGIFENLSLDDDNQFQKQIHQLTDKYVKIEFSPTMTIEDKTPYMQEWWRESHNLIVQNKVTNCKMEELVKSSDIILKDKCMEFLTLMEMTRVPFVLFSAGIGNIIEYAFMQQVGRIPQNTHIISNFMEFDSNGVCSAFFEPLIHTFNKNSTVIKKEASFFHQLATKTSVLLLGDSLGDVHMDVGVETELVVLKIGFLNFNSEKLLEKYMEEYDIVLVEENSLDVPLQIMELIKDGQQGFDSNICT